MTRSVFRNKTEPVSLPGSNPCDGQREETVKHPSNAGVTRLSATAPVKKMTFVFDVSRFKELLNLIFSGRRHQLTNEDCP
jgi:hypothetical protein